MITIYLDLENTVIKSIDDPVFIEENCCAIKSMLHKYKYDFVHIFTWGWVEHDEIDNGLADTIFERLCIPVEHRGTVITKRDSVDELCRVFPWAYIKYKNEMLSPGGMQSLGLTKAACFLMTHGSVKTDTSHASILIDDTVSNHASVTSPLHIIRITRDIDTETCIYGQLDVLRKCITHNKLVKIGIEQAMSGKELIPYINVTGANFSRQYEFIIMYPDHNVLTKVTNPESYLKAQRAIKKSIKENTSLLDKLRYKLSQCRTRTA